MKDFDLKPAKDLNLSRRERVLSIHRESGLIDSCMHRLWRLGTGIYLRLYHRLSMQGIDNLPAKPPFVIVANHCSHLDAIVLASVLPGRWADRVFPIAAGDIFFETPVMASFASVFINALPMWRHNCGRHALKQLRQRLVDDRCVYILFPEGTRSPDGTLQDFKAGLGMMLAKSGVPIIPCYLNGAYQAWPRHRKVPLPGRITLTIGQKVDILDYENCRDGWGKIVRKLRDAVLALAPQ